MRIAMWSGPRNISTAMMYSFANRLDFAVWDEPFYAAYLLATGIDHPMREDVLRQHETDPEVISKSCVGPIPLGKPNFYMKHMPFHMVDGFPMNWADECINVHLIRHPSRVIASYAAKRDAPNLQDIGFAEQAALFERYPGPVLDSADIRRDPAKMLKLLCAEIGLAFDPAMLSWEAGRRDFDGVWAAHWYGAVHRSTGFAGPEGALPELTGELQDLAEEAMPFYQELAVKKLG